MDQKRRQSHSLTVGEDLALHGEKMAVPVSQHENQISSFPYPALRGSREGVVKFDLPSFGRQPRSDKQDKGLSDLGPLSTLPEEEVVSSASAPRRGLFKSLADKISGQHSPRSPV